MALDNMRDLMLQGMQAAYNAERRQIEGYPGAMETLEEPAAREGLQASIDETKAHSERLERIFTQMGEEPVRAENPIMDGIFRNLRQVVEESSDRGVRDSGFVAVLQLSQHYAIANYGTLRTYAEALGMDEAVGLLQQTLEEEKAQDEKLTELAVKVANPRAQR